jgi:hypothetical protein
MEDIRLRFNTVDVHVGTPGAAPLPKCPLEVNAQCECPISDSPAIAFLKGQRTQGPKKVAHNLVVKSPEGITPPQQPHFSFPMLRSQIKKRREVTGNNEAGASVPGRKRKRVVTTPKKIRPSPVEKMRLSPPGQRMPLVKNRLSVNKSGNCGVVPRELRDTNEFKGLAPWCLKTKRSRKCAMQFTIATMRGKDYNIQTQ